MASEGGEVVVGSPTKWAGILKRGGTLVGGGKGNEDGAMVTDGVLDVTLVAGSNETGINAGVIK